jgi:hypothetical protein
MAVRDDDLEILYTWAGCISVVLLVWAAFLVF